MPSDATMEKLSKVLGLFNDGLKVLTMAVLSLLAISAVAAPDFVKARLEKLGFEIKEVNLLFAKLVAKETTRAAASTLTIAEALTKAELQLQQAAAGVSPTAAGQAAALDGAVKELHIARTALDQQAAALRESGKAAGATVAAPKLGWLYVGIFSPNNAAVRLSDRIDSAAGVKFSSGKDIESIALRFDAGIVANGDDCTTTKAADFQPPDPNQPEQEYAVLRASPTPLRVIKTHWCTHIGGNRSAYVQIEVPPERVRFAPLSTLPVASQESK